MKRPSSKAYTLTFSKAELVALSVVASEGIEGIVTDHEACKGYLGGRNGAYAAIRAVEKIRLALQKG